MSPDRDSVAARTVAALLVRADFAQGVMDNVGTTASAGRVATVPVGSVVEREGGVTTLAVVSVRATFNGGGAWLQYGKAAW